MMKGAANAGNGGTFLLTLSRGPCRGSPSGARWRAELSAACLPCAATAITRLPLPLFRSLPGITWNGPEKDLAKLFDGKDKDWVDFPLAFMGALRMAAFGAALGGASTPKGARFKAAAFSAAAFVNLTEFLLRAMKGLPLRLEGK